MGLYDFPLFHLPVFLWLCLLLFIVALSFYIAFSSLRGKFLCSIRAFSKGKKNLIKVFSGGFAPSPRHSFPTHRPCLSEIFLAGTADFIHTILKRGSSKHADKELRKEIMLRSKLKRKVNKIRRTVDSIRNKES